MCNAGYGTRRGSRCCGGSLTDVYTVKTSISNSFPGEAKDFISLEIRFLLLLYNPIKTPMLASRVMAWGSNKSSTVPDLGILKRTEFSTSGCSQYRFLKASRCHLESCLPCGVSCPRCVWFAQRVAWQGTLTSHAQHLPLDTSAVFFFFSYAFQSAVSLVWRTKGRKKSPVLRLGLGHKLI